MSAAQENAICLALLTATWLLLGFIGAGCTVAPRSARSGQASWDGTEQNSGIIAELPDHRFLITEHARSRYLGLVSEYGFLFNPKITGAEPGLDWTGTNGFFATPEILEHFATMNRWHKQGVRTP